MVVYQRITFISNNSKSASNRSLFMCRRTEPLRPFICSIVVYVYYIIFCSCFFSNRYVVIVFKLSVSSVSCCVDNYGYTWLIKLSARIVVDRIHTRYAESLMRSRAQFDFITCEVFYADHDILISSMRWCTTVGKWRFLYRLSSSFRNNGLMKLANLCGWGKNK